MTEKPKEYRLRVNGANLRSLPMMIRDSEKRYSLEDVKPVIEYEESITLSLVYGKPDTIEKYLVIRWILSED